MTVTDVRTAELTLEPEAPFDAITVDRLVADAFGPGRWAKTAERLREGSLPVAGWVARHSGRAVGTVRLWPILIGATPALFLGPIAVDASERRSGLGARLVEAAVAWAGERDQGILLVGDTPYFGRFGFEQANEVRLPGPVDRRRVLWRGAVQPSGSVRAAPPDAAN